MTPRCYVIKEVRLWREGGRGGGSPPPPPPPPQRDGKSGEEKRGRGKWRWRKRKAESVWQRDRDAEGEGEDGRKGIYVEWRGEKGYMYVCIYEQGWLQIGLEGRVC
jgi:hypothetical protein